MAFIQNQIGATTSIGTIWMNHGDWNGLSFSITTSYTEVGSLATSFTLMSPSQDFAMTTDGRLKYTGIQTRNFLVSSLFNTDTAADTATAIYKNGSIIAGSAYYSSLGSLSSSGIQVSLATNDYLSLFAKNASNISISIYQATLTAKSIL